MSWENFGGDDARWLRNVNGPVTARRMFWEHRYMFLTLVAVGGVALFANTETGNVLVKQAASLLGL